MSWPNTMIVFGTILIALGGIVATAGWNSRSEVARRGGLVDSIAAEAFVNLNVIRDPAYTETDPDKLKKQAIYYRFRTTSFENAISSGLLFHEKDRELLTRTSQLLEMLHDFNNRIAMIEESIVRLDGAELAKYRARLRDMPARAQIDKKLVLLMKLLMETYGVEGDTQFSATLQEDAA